MSYLYSKLPETGVSPHIGTGGILRFNRSDTIAQDRHAAALGGVTLLSTLKYHRER
jgi:hypothetical protein